MIQTINEKMFLIIGLGNPTEKYDKTRHNLGFMLIDFLANQSNVAVKREECRALIGRAEIENQIVELVKPQTYMNLSGESVAGLLRKRQDAKIIVISDDLALPLGKIRIRPKGSAGGHNGLKSIIECLGTDEFYRIRIGIQPEHQLSDTKKFVLEKFKQSDFDTVEKVLEESAEAVYCIIRDGIEKAMAKFN
ncbi:MAG: aminoacyl-tRNA hydrolase [Pyrinomonadaceae bacterium]|jgi:peptidyl-tRNA hydrolase, PTH1 family|nr:aminoacyl-tRNA hydrolase [Pyrinomonadaceae bacterium]